MRSGTKLIERHIAATILPYIALALLLLTAVLVTQQSNRFAELIGQARAPLSLVLEITLNLTPSLLVFTAPMAVLAGTLIGFSRLGGDSELIALRAAGVGGARLYAAPVLVGVAASLALLWLNLYYAPIAATRLRDAALRAAEERLRSPIQPGTFTIVKDKVIYVRDGDEARGIWKGVFVFSQERDGRALLVTAETGRLDSSQDVAELVLQGAVATTLDLSAQDEKGKGSPKPPAESASRIGIINPSSEQVMSERAAQTRVKIDDGLGLLVKRLRERQPELDESTASRLRQIARDAPKVDQRRAAQIALQKKYALGLAPLCFAVLGAAIGSRVQRGGRGLGVLLSFLIMIFYYMLVLAGEQAARAGTLPVIPGVWLATGATLLATFAVVIASRINFGRGAFTGKSDSSRLPREAVGGAGTDDRDTPGAERSVRGGGDRSMNRSRAATQTFFGLLDRDLSLTLCRNFLFALAALTSLFVIFTVFELWRHVTANNTGWRIVFEYTLYLLPFIFAALAPIAILIAVLFTYAVLSRRSETIAWLAAGQSVYRLFVPSLALACLAGGALWFVQDDLLPIANQRQDALRDRIRTGAPKTAVAGGREWVAAGESLYTHRAKSAVGNPDEIDSPIIFEYQKNLRHIGKVILGTKGKWNERSSLILMDATVVDLTGTDADANSADVGGVALERPDAVPFNTKLAFLRTPELETLAAAYERKGDVSNSIKTRLTLERRKMVGVAPLVMVLVAMPLAIVFGRRGALLSLCGAVAIGVLFWGASSGFELVGSYGLLPIGIAVWGAPTLFAVAGSYLLARTRT